MNNNAITKINKENNCFEKGLTLIKISKKNSKDSKTGPINKQLNHFAIYKLLVIKYVDKETITLSNYIRDHKIPLLIARSRCGK
jgi:hypothetical protein